MKLARKGFTLVELLIVVAIMSALSATMTMSVRGSTAGTKAAVIASNVEACKRAAALCFANSEPSDLVKKKAVDVLKEYVPTWADFEGGKNISYTAEGEGIDKWALKVNFAGDPEHDDIKTSLQKIKGYNKYYKSATDTVSTDVMPNGKYAFTVMLYSGKMSADVEPEESQGD